jgi:hypothetical protein
MDAPSPRMSEEPLDRVRSTLGGGTSRERRRAGVLTDIHFRPAAGGAIVTYRPSTAEVACAVVLPGDLDERAHPTDQLFERRKFIARKAARLLESEHTVGPDPVTPDGTDVLPTSVGLVVVHPDGSLLWRDRSWGLHRGDGPAVQRSDGLRAWWRHGAPHRADGPAVEHPGGDREWWVDGVRHREDGPAVERSDGSREWWVLGIRHRADGPAIEGGPGTPAWWVNGVSVPEPPARPKRRWRLFRRKS